MIYIIFLLLLAGCVSNPATVPYQSGDNISDPAPVISLPEGWVQHGVLAAAWGSGLPEVTPLIPDTGYQTEFWEENIPVDNREVVIPRASVTYQKLTPASKETWVLRFINIANLYEPLNLDDDQYLLIDIQRTIRLLDAGDIRVTADDVMKRKVLMRYGTPVSFDGNRYLYYDDKTEMAIQVLDDQTLFVQSSSIGLKEKLAVALESEYSREAIDQKINDLLKNIEF
ncbi:MAG: hypothetical protein ACE5D8_10535 [Fidelibacterota bacterium]